MQSIVLLALTVNCLSCMIARYIQGGKLVAEAPKGWQTEPIVWLIAGLRNQPERAYQYMNFGYHKRGYLSYSNFGYSPYSAGEQLNKIAKDGDVVCGVSIGAKAVEMSKLNGSMILINPCSNPGTLKSVFRYSTQYLTILAEIISYGLGWISVLPIIPGDMGTHQSLASLVDQLFWIGHGQPNVERPKETGVIISNQDEFLERDLTYRQYHKCRIEEIDTKHARIASKDEGVVLLYQNALDKLLQ